MKRVFAVTAALALLGMGGIQCASAAPVQWSTSVGGNDHWYEAVLVAGDVTWADSKVAAESVGGYLATVTSEAENDFVFSLVKHRPEFWWNQGGPWLNGPWLGGYQDRSDPSYSEPVGGWKWVTGETWSYTNWMQGEPSGTDQDYLHYCGYNLKVAPTWDDAGASYVYQPYRGYVVELQTVPNEEVPEPMSAILATGGLISLWGVRRRRA